MSAMRFALALAMAGAVAACHEGYTFVMGQDSGICYFDGGDAYKCNCPWASCSGLNGSCELSGLSIGLIVALVVIIIACIAACVWCCCCRNRAATTTIVTSQPGVYTPMPAQQPYVGQPQPQQAPQFAQ